MPKSTARQGHSRRELILGLSGSLTLTQLLADSASGAEEADCTTIDLSAIAEGEQYEFAWRGRRIYVRHRTAEEIASARAVALSDLPDPQSDEDRVQDPSWLVVYGECPHAGCKPLGELGDFGGWLCMCHGSHFDAAGRIRKGPARRNLEIPPYRIVDHTHLELGCFRFASR